MSEPLQVLIGDCRETLATLESASVQCCVTSPPYYGLRDYGHDGQIGLEQTPDEYVAELVKVFQAVKRVLRDDGVLFLNLGDSYASMNRSGRKESPGVGAKQEVKPVHTVVKWASGDGSKFQWRIPAFGTELKPKDLIGIPWRVAFALQQDGWYLRQDIIWHKPNPMPESVRDRCTKAHEYVFLLSKSARYYWDAEAISEPAEYGDNGSTFDGEYDRATKPNLGKKPRARCAGNKAHKFTAQYENGSSEHRTAAGLLNAAENVYTSRNKRSVWSISTQPYSGAHFATMPPKLAETCILAGSKAGDTILDPFGGSGTTGMVALENGRKAILCELNESYAELINHRTQVTVGFGF